MGPVKSCHVAIGLVHDGLSSAAVSAMTLNYGHVRPFLHTATLQPRAIRVHNHHDGWKARHAGHGYGCEPLEHPHCSKSALRAVPCRGSEASPAASLYAGLRQGTFMHTLPRRPATKPKTKTPEGFA